MCYVCVALVEGCKAGFSHIISAGVIEFKRGGGGWGLCTVHSSHGLRSCCLTGSSSRSASRTLYSFICCCIPVPSVNSPWQWLILVFVIYWPPDHHMAWTLGRINACCPPVSRATKT